MKNFQKNSLQVGNIFHGEFRGHAWVTFTTT